MQLGHLLTRSGLTCPETSSKACHDFYCQSGNYHSKGVKKNSNFGQITGIQEKLDTTCITEKVLFLSLPGSVLSFTQEHAADLHGVGTVPNSDFCRRNAYKTY
jgi:hypothetical protein